MSQRHVELRKACPVCRLGIEEAMVESANYHLCPSCQVLYTAKIPHIDPEEGWDNAYYSDERVINHYLKRHSGFRRMVEIMNRRIPERGKWLDVGCGVGMLLQAAHEQGWGTYGIDPSYICVERARRRMKYAEIVQGTIEGMYHKFVDFNVVSFTDALRSVEQPGPILASLQSVLVQGGWVLIREINADFLRKERLKELPASEVKSTGYLQQWNPQSLEKALILSGFRNVHSIPSPAFLETGDYEDGDAGFKAEIRKSLKPVLWPLSRLVHRLSCGRLYLAPNFITLGQR